MANAISLARILLVPFVAVLILSHSQPVQIAGAALYGVAAGTDWLDGYVARSSRGQVTELGRVIDPLADRLLIVTTVIILYVRLEGLLPWWILATIALREVGALAGYQVLTWLGRRPAVNIYGKITTALILIGVSVVLVGAAFRVDVMTRGGVVWLMVAGVAHVFSGLSYLLEGRTSGGRFR